MRITKTCLYNFDPLKPHFYIVKLRFTGVYIIFLISAQNIDCGYSLEPLGEAVLTSTHNLCFEQKYEKYQNFLNENFHFLVGKFSVYLNRHVFVMGSSTQMSNIVPVSLILTFGWQLRLDGMLFGLCLRGSCIEKCKCFCTSAPL